MWGKEQSNDLPEFPFTKLKKNLCLKHLADGDESQP